MEKIRMINYLKCRYDEYSPKKLAFKMDVVLNRLLKGGQYEKEFLLDVVADLSQRKWTKSKIVAYLDILDVEERT
tara:strand:- start:27051 stop:27275 length:225 start_codon:yes stop_codon:yes gene_type:complete